MVNVTRLPVSVLSVLSVLSSDVIAGAVWNPERDDGYLPGGLLSILIGACLFVFFAFHSVLPDKANTGLLWAIGGLLVFAVLRWLFF